MSSETQTRHRMTEPVLAGSAAGLVLMAALTTTLLLASASGGIFAGSTMSDVDTIEFIISGGFNLFLGCLMIGIFIAFPVAWLFVGMMRISEECYAWANSTLIWVVSGGLFCFAPTMAVYLSSGGSMLDRMAIIIIVPFIMAGMAGGYAARKKRLKVWPESILVQR